jgi:hypothetical protein
MAKIYGNGAGASFSRTLSNYLGRENGAAGENRTPDLTITNGQKGYFRGPLGATWVPILVFSYNRLLTPRLISANIGKPRKTQLLLPRCYPNGQDIIDRKVY